MNAQIQFPITTPAKKDEPSEATCVCDKSHSFFKIDIRIDIKTYSTPSQNSISPITLKV